MSELIDRMLKQFDQMRDIAEANARMANQALDERNAAHVVLMEAQQTLQATRELLNNPDAEESDANTVDAQAAAAIAKCREILEPAPQKFWTTP